MNRFAIVTATTDPVRARACIESWGDAPCVIVLNGSGTASAEECACASALQAHWIVSPSYLGTVPAFQLGVDYLLEAQPEIEVIACLHDDLEITEAGWDARVVRLFDARPACGLAGFGGARGLGSNDLYRVPYAPQQLARQGFRSNLIDAEKHGMRSLVSERVACLDGFSQIGRRAFWLGHNAPSPFDCLRQAASENLRPWTYLESLGVIHHFYDGMLGCLAARYGWETWYLPVGCIHYGGRTAVADPGYHAWADEKTKSTEGDHEFWKAAHQIGYEVFRDVLPLRA